MEINKVLKEMEFFFNIFNILEEDGVVLREVNEEEETDYRNSYSHYRDITVTVASLQTLLHPPRKLLNIARLSNALVSARDSV